jgi:uncharacterized membrane-anchored protein YhcB (DUF1043 family)
VKKYLLILFCLALVVYINGGKDQNCLKELKIKAQSLKQYGSYKKVEAVKQTMKEIIKGLEKCGLSKEEVKPFKKIQKDIRLEIEKLARAQKKLPSAFYSNKINGMLNALGKKYPELKQKIPVKEKQEKQITPEVKPKQQKREGTAASNETKIETSFPAEAYDNRKVSKESGVKNMSVITANQLSTGMDLLEKQVAYLSGTVRFYNYAFVFTIIILFVLVGLMVLFGLLLRRQTKKSQHIEHQMKLMRKSLEYYRKNDSGGMEQ